MSEANHQTVTGFPAPDPGFSEPIPTYVFSGFLGSGKTTLLIELLRYARTTKRKAAVLMNEFGNISIDGELLKGEGFSVLELSDGCICCQIGEDLIQAFTEVASRQPEMIFVEATGLADPVDLIDQATAPHLLSLVRIARLVTVADPRNFPRLSKVLKAIVKRQTQFADVVVISKADEATAEQIEEIRTFVQNLNPYASVCLAHNGCVSGDETFTWLFAEEDGNDQHARRQAMRAGIDALSDEAYQAHRDFHTLSCHVIHPLDREKFEAFIRDLPPEVLRVKGFVRFSGQDGLWVMMYVGGDLYIRPVSLSPAPAEHLVFIGSALNHAALASGLTGCEVKRRMLTIL